MAMYTGMMHSHNGLAYLLLLSTTVSLMLAMATALLGARTALLRVGGVLRGVEAGLMGLIGLIGIAMWVMAAWPIGTWWLWAGVLVLLAQGAFLARGIKPAQRAAAEGEGAGRWVLFAMLHWAVVLGIFGIMQAN